MCQGTSTTLLPGVPLLACQRCPSQLLRNGVLAHAAVLATHAAAPWQRAHSQLCMVITQESLKDGMVFSAK